MSSDQASLLICLHQGHSTEGASSKLCSSKFVCLSTTSTNQLKKQSLSKVDQSSNQKHSFTTSKLCSSGFDCLSPGEILDPHTSPTTSEDTDKQAAGVLTEKEKEVLLEHYYSLYPRSRPIQGLTTGICDPDYQLCCSCQANWRPRSQRITKRRVEVDQQPNPENMPIQGGEDSCAQGDTTGVKAHLT